MFRPTLPINMELSTIYCDQSFVFVKVISVVV